MLYKNEPSAATLGELTDRKQFPTFSGAHSPNQMSDSDDKLDLEKDLKDDESIRNARVESDPDEYTVPPTTRREHRELIEESKGSDDNEDFSAPPETARRNNLEHHAALQRPSELEQATLNAESYPQRRGAQHRQTAPKTQAASSVKPRK